MRPAVSLATTILIAAVAIAPGARADATHECVAAAPPAAPAPNTSTPACHRAPTSVATAVTAAIAKEFTPERDHGRVDVAFDCDGLGAHVRDIVVERGSGHGGSLQLWHAIARADGDYDVRGILYQGDSMGGRAAAIPHVQAAGTISLPDLETVRAGLAASISEIDPPPPPNTIDIGSVTFSSNDFELLIRVTDDDGRVVERRYVGYGGSKHQATYLGLEVAAAALAPMFALAANKLPADATDRALFAERFIAAVPHFDDDFDWWVMERYVDLARFLGDRTAIPGLLTRMVLPAKPDRSKRDARVQAVDAIARITGWDARAGGHSIDDAAATYVRSCTGP